MKKVKNIEDYIDSAPENVKSKLLDIKRLIKKIVPEAEEKISYDMPYFSYKGRLAYFAYFKDHISFFAMNGVLEDYEKEVKKYKTGKATLRFDLNEDLPLKLIKKLVSATYKKNKAK